MATATDGTRQHIIDALVERGYGILEVTWVHDLPNFFGAFGLSTGGMWAATYRNPLTGEIAYITGRFLGQLLEQVARLPEAVSPTPPHPTDAEGRA